MNQPFIYLASSSPRRRELLDQLGVRHVAHPVDIDESRHGDETARVYVTRLALGKAQAALRLGSDAPVLGADTVVVVDDEPLGKPTDRDHAIAMLGRLSGRVHTVLTAVATISDGESHTVLSETEVVFRNIPAEERAAYWETGEPADKAGAYAIQGRGAVFVERINGSYSGVMGLPLFETAQLLERAGVQVLA